MNNSITSTVLSVAVQGPELALSAFSTYKYGDAIKLTILVGYCLRL